MWIHTNGYEEIQMHMKTYECNEDIIQCNEDMNGETYVANWS